MAVKIDPSWYAVLQQQFEAPYFGQLKEFLVACAISKGSPSV